MMHNDVAMRTTLNLDDDVAAEAERLKREEGIGLSEAINRLARAGMVQRMDRTVFVNRAAPIGLKVDVSNISEVLDLLED